MAVHYKFKNTINYDAIKFDGVYISAADLKSNIVQQKKLGHSELQVINEETQHVYNDDEMVPKNTNVIVSRLPFPQSNKRTRPVANQHGNNHHYHHNNNSSHHHNNHGRSSAHPSAHQVNPGLSQNNGSNNTNNEALELVSKKTMTEEEKIKFIQTQSTKDFDPARYPRGGRGGYHHRGGSVSRGGGSHRIHPGYVCRKCNIPGHSIYECKVGSVPRIKRSSGIPRDFLMKVDSKEKGALVTPSGEYVVPFIDREAYSNPKVEKAPFFEDGTPDDGVIIDNYPPAANKDGSQYNSLTDTNLGPSTSYSEYTNEIPLAIQAGPSSIINSDNTDLDIKPEVDTVTDTLVSYHQGVKRNYDLVSRESDLENHSKKSKLGFAVPNWKNITKSTQPDADRYAHYHMVQLRSQCEALVTTRERRLITMPMYTISTNVLCRYTKDGKDIYVPLEISIFCYTIDQGKIGKPFHVIIDSGSCPSGTVNLSRDHTEATHQISNPSKGKYPLEARNDYLNIYKEMLKYTKGGERTILVPDERDMAQVKGCLDWLHERAVLLSPDLPKITTWTILPMVEYVTAACNFVFLRMLHSVKPPLALHYKIKLKQEDSTWDYFEEFMCQYHRKLECHTKWCAKSCATRAFLAIEGILNDIYKAYKAATEGAKLAGTT